MARELVQSEQRYCEQLDLVVTVSLSTGPTLHKHPWAELVDLVSNNTLMENHLSGLDLVIETEKCVRCDALIVRIS